MQKFIDYFKDKRKFLDNKKLFYSIILICFVSRLVIALRPIEYIDGYLIPDDAYYVLKIAKNIAAGNGPFCSDNYTNGFQPLYVFLLVPVFFVFPNDLIAPVHISLIYSALFDSITLIFIFKILAMYCKSGWTFIAGALVWISNSYVIQNSLNGLETALSVLFIVLTLYYFLILRQLGEFSNRRLFILGVIAGLAALARIDNFLLLACILIILIFERYFSGLKEKIKLKSLLYILAGCLLIYLPWVIYSYVYTGDLYQVSGKALRFHAFIMVQADQNDMYSFLSIETAFATVFAQNRKLVLGSLLNLAVLFFALKKEKGVTSIKEILSPAVSFLLLFSVLLVAAYALYIYSFWFYARYLYPAALLFIFLLLQSIDKIINTGKKFAVPFVLILVIMIAIKNLYSQNISIFYLSKETEKSGYMNLGNWARDKFPSGTVIGAAQSGALEYFAFNQKIINLDGVVNKEFYQSSLKKEGMDYIKKKKIDYIIAWESNIRYLKLVSTEYKESDLTYLETINNFKSWDTFWHLYKVNY